jgi:hypothetical protein
MESDHGLVFSLEHDLFGKPASTFPDHALTALAVVVLLRPGPRAYAIAPIGLTAASADRPVRQAAALRRARAAAFGVGALAGTRFNLAPQAVIAAQPGQPGTSPADPDGARSVGLPDQRYENQSKDDGH